MALNCNCSTHFYIPMEIPPMWLELRERGQLCDGLVKCIDGEEFKIHRVLLAAVSPYFRALFTDSINIKKADIRVAHVDAPGHIFRQLLSFAYSGSCRIDEGNYESLTGFADQYGILGVMHLCFQFISEKMTLSNCFETRRFANKHYCKELDRYCRRFILVNFVDVLKHSEIKCLNYFELEEILNDDELNIRHEEIVFETIKIWVEHDTLNRKDYLFNLLQTIRFGNLPYDYLRLILEWQPIYTNNTCKSVILRALKALGNAVTELDLITNTMFRPRVPYEILFAIGGWTAGSPTNYIETYDSRADKWVLNTHKDTTPRAYHGICSLNNKIYVIGGCDGSEHYSTVRCFDAETFTWSSCSCMHHARCYVSVTTHGGHIYAIGGFNGRTRMSSVERYNCKENQWYLIQQMFCERSDASAATLNEKIYVVGGFNGTDVLSSAEVYDPALDQWTFIEPMMSARSGVSLIGYQGALYVFGGFNGVTRLASAERLVLDDPDAIWEEISEMYYPRSNFAAVVLEGYVYVIGGFNDQAAIGATTINNVECYDPESNLWMEASPMNLHRSALSACVVKGLPNAKEYSIHGVDFMNRSELAATANR